MPKTVDVPGIGLTEFPDNMSDDDISAAIRQQIGWKPPHSSAIYQLANQTLNPNLPDYGHPALAGIAQAPLNATLGVMKGALSTAAGLGSIYNRLTGSNQPFNQQNLSQLTDVQPNHAISQGIGKYGEQAAEFLAGGEGAAEKLLANPKVAALAANSPKLAKFALKPAIEAAAATPITAAQTGGSPAAIGINATIPFLARPLIAATGKILSTATGLTTGAGKDAIERAFANPASNGLARTMRGDLNDVDVVNNLQDMVTNYRDNAATAYGKDLDNVFSKQLPPDWGKASGDALQNMRNQWDQQLSNFRVQRVANPNTGETALDFTLNHSIDPDTVKTIDNMLSLWDADPARMTPAGLDALKQNIGHYSGVGGQTNAMVDRLYDAAKNAINPIIPGYAEMTSKYAQAQDFLRKMNSELGVDAAGQKNPGTISRKLQYLLKQPGGNTYRRWLLEQFGPEGQDILDQIAGLHLRQMLPRGLLGPVSVGLGEVMLRHDLPQAITLGLAGSPRLIGEGARAAGAVGANNIARIGVPATQAATDLVQQH